MYTYIYLSAVAVFDFMTLKYTTKGLCRYGNSRAFSAGLDFRPNSCYSIVFIVWEEAA